MQYHALALASSGRRVVLLGYRGAPPDREVLEHPSIRVDLLPTPWRQRAPRALYLPASLADVAAQTGLLLRRLVATGAGELLVQTPPAIPTLAVARLAARLLGARLIVDWHNFGADLLGLKLGRGHPAVRAAAAFERVAGAGAGAHLCVSEAMRVELRRRYALEATVLRDRPARRAPRPSPAERAALFARLGVEATAGARVVVTSSSWSLDEDFALLLDALARCDAATRTPLLFLVTGTGPLRAAWEREVARLALSRVSVRTLWVESEDYPRLLAAADVGVSLHRSASGVDLPMKIADMFGAGLPVCALAYGPVIEELVRPGENGLLFEDAATLATQIVELAGGPEGDGRLEELRRGVARRAALGWIEGWRTEAAPLFAPA
jgi:beta-1,4-mannosyltransferase